MHSQLRSQHFRFSCFWVSCQSTALRSFEIRSFVVFPKRDLMFHVGDTACQRSAINVSDRQSTTTPFDSGEHRRVVTDEIM